MANRSRVSGKLQLLMLAVVGLAVSGCGNDSDLAVTDQSKTIRRSVPWHIVERASSETLKIVANVEYCVGEVQPAIANLKVSEKRGVMVITLEAAVAPPRELRRDEVCLGAEKPLYRTIMLSRPIDELTIADGSYDPPKPKWSPR